MVAITESRSFMLAYALALCAFLLEDSIHVRGRWIKYSVYGLFLLLVVVAPLAILFSEFFGTMGILFRSAMTVVITGSADQDGSANVRIAEASAMMPFVKEHLLLGCGAISKQWDVAASALVGGRFSVADIGILGGLFLYGIVGVAVILSPFAYALRWTRFVNTSTDDVFAVSCKYFLLFCLLNTILGAIAIQTPGPTLLFVVLIYCIVMEKRNGTG